MEYIDQSEVITGYKVKVIHKPAFKVLGFTLLIPPHSDEKVGQFWDQLLSDGRIEKLVGASSVPTSMLGLGSWDPECEKGGGFRYTICIEETEHTDFSRLSQEYPLFTKQIDETDWLVFETDMAKFEGQFWKDDPYKMMGPLGYKFNARGYNLGLHFEVYPPGFDPASKPEIEFWITVKKRKDAGNQHTETEHE